MSFVVNDGLFFSESFVVVEKVDCDWIPRIDYHEYPFAAVQIYLRPRPQRSVCEISFLFSSLSHSHFLSITHHADVRALKSRTDIADN